LPENETTNLVENPFEVIIFPRTKSRKGKIDYAALYEAQWQARFVNRTAEWQEFYKKADVFTKGQLLEHRASHSFNTDELNEVWARLIKRMPNEARIVYALAKNPYTPEDIKSAAAHRYNQIWAGTPAALAWQATWRHECEPELARLNGICERVLAKSSQANSESVE